MYGNTAAENLTKVNDHFLPDATRPLCNTDTLLLQVLNILHTRIEVCCLHGYGQELVGCTEPARPVYPGYGLIPTGLCNAGELHTRTLHEDQSKENHICL